MIREKLETFLVIGSRTFTLELTALVGARMVGEE